MQIEHKGFTSDLDSFIKEELLSTWERGELEQTIAKISNVAAAIGRLLDALVDKKILTLTEALHIANCFDDVKPV